MGEPSLRFTIVHRFSGLPIGRTEYICGKNTRSETRNYTGRSATTPPTNVQYEYGPLRVHIHNRDLAYGFELDLAARIYTAFRANQYGSPLWLKPRKVQPFERTGKTVHVHIETIDTGERREVFGYTARHVITRTNETRDAELLNESECDGWYIDAPAAWLALHPTKPGTFYRVSSLTNGKRDDYKYTDTGKRETGFLVRATQTRKSFRDGMGTAGVRESLSEEEITEFSETPLEAELFVPPRDFRRVPQLPSAMRHSFSYRTRHRWEMLKDAFSLRNQISRFARSHSKHELQRGR